MPSESRPAPPETPPALCVVGKKNSGKTTLMVALVAELSARGWRVATIKHGHHAFESDEPGRDSWRHFNEGGAEASMMCGTGKVALTMRIPGEPDPETLVREFFSGRGYHLVLIEGWKHGPLPRIEVFRREAHAAPIGDGSAAGGFVAVVTDDSAQSSVATIPVFAPDDISGIADFIQDTVIHGR